MREKCIRNYPIVIVRFTNEDIEKNLIAVMNQLEEIINKRKLNFGGKLQENS
jgi:very-short-patch-repair endonuclease